MEYTLTKRTVKNNMDSGKSARGFTLLELMIAIGIFAILATACYRLLSTSGDAQEAMSDVWSGLNTLQRGHLIIEKDLRHMIARPVRDSENNLKFAMYGGVEESDKRVLVAFTRSGHYNLTNEMRSDFMRVMYTVESNKLVRYLWFFLDSVEDKPPLRQVIMDDLDKVKMIFLDQKKRWINQWPPVSENQETRMRLLPQAISLTFDHERYGHLQWWFPGVDAPPAKVNILKDNDRDIKREREYRNIRRENEYRNIRREREYKNIRRENEYRKYGERSGRERTEQDEWDER